MIGDPMQIGGPDSFRDNPFKNRKWCPKQHKDWEPVTIWLPVWVAGCWYWPGSRLERRLVQDYDGSMWEYREPPGA